MAVPNPRAKQVPFGIQITELHSLEPANDSEEKAPVWVRTLVISALSLVLWGAIIWAGFTIFG